MRPLVSTTEFDLIHSHKQGCPLSFNTYCHVVKQQRAIYDVVIGLGQSHSHTREDLGTILGFRSNAPFSISHYSVTFLLSVQQQKGCVHVCLQSMNVCLCMRTTARRQWTPTCCNVKKQTLKLISVLM